MSQSVLLPAGAPFGAEQILALNSVIAISTAEQRAWLSGFLAGVQAANAPVATPATPTRPKTPLTILFGSESGNAESLAARARKAATRLGFAVKLLDMADTTPAQAAAAINLLVIASTWGEGDPPQRATDFYAALMAGDAPKFDQTRFAVLALGDHAYARFCEVGRQIDERIAALGGNRIADRIECDVEFEAPSGAWIDETLARIAPPGEESSVIHVDFGRADHEGWTRANPFVGEITDHVRLSGSRSTSDTRHIAVSLEGSAIQYEPGDSLGFVPRNDPMLVDEILNAAGLEGNDALRESLRDKYDITTLTQKQALDHCALAGAASPEDNWHVSRQIIDLLEAFPRRSTPEQLIGLLRPLAPRYYSIASSQKVAGDEAHLLVASVRYETHGRARLGVASNELNARAKAGDNVRVFLRANPNFRLPAESDRPIIMIGPGTGVAPFRAFVQERQAIGAKGKNWLVFGHRTFQHDFLYQLEWQDWIKDGVLNRIDVAFSRDQTEKRYVQHALWDARAELAAWVADGASVYVCGDMAAMAKDVHAMLGRILGEEQLDILRRERRYLRDVY